MNLKKNEMDFQSPITFVFSDIEHSTRLAFQLDEKYPEVLERHRAVIRNMFRKYKGREIDTAGDGFFLTFGNPHSAVHAAVDIQREFNSQKWAKEIDLRVRMGIHTGNALPTESGFTGIEVHRASRICDAAHGGQVLISYSTKKALINRLEKDLSLVYLGNYLLKDFNEPVKLFQLNIRGLIQKFPNLRVNPEEKKIAVLPFSNMSNKPDQEHIGDGMAEEIIVALGKIHGLRVVSRSSSFALKYEDMDTLNVGRKLNVNSVLEGRIRNLNGQMIVSIELIDTDSGLNIWSGQYDTGRNSLLNVQQEITYRVTEALGCKMIPEQTNSFRQRQSQNAEAYDFYLRGRRFYLQFSTRGIELALQMFDKAIEADNMYGLAYAGKSDCYSYLVQHKERSNSIIVNADKMSQMAIELGPALVEAHVSRGIILWLMQKFKEAEKYFKYAIERDPTYFLGWFHYGRACFAVGKLDKAARLFEQANRVDPDDYQSILLSAQAYNDIGITDLAETLRRRGVEIAEKRLELNPGDTRALYLSANALVFLGEPEKSKKLLQQALVLEPDDSMLLYNAGCVYTLLGMKAEALTCLEGAFHAGLTLLGWYEHDSNLDSLRNEPRFISLLAQIKEIVK